jgi:nucleoside-diphosphate-sugar epimerase
MDKGGFNLIEGRKVLVTGGAGFIGSELVKQLNQYNNYVTVLDNFSSGKKEYIIDDEKIMVIKGDVMNEETVSRAINDQEYVIHLAALPFIPDSYNYPDAFFKTNTIGSINVAWEAIKSETVEKLVYISTSEVYGTAKYVPMDEDHPTLPHSTYAVSKLAADRAVFTMHKEHNFPVTIIRPFNSYGPNITQPYIIPEIINQLINGANVLHLGNIESSRDFTYVSDTARGMLLALSSDKATGETINVGSGYDIKIKDLAYSIAEVMGKKIKIEIDKERYRPFDVNRLYASNIKAKDLLGWTPKVPLKEGLGKTVAWLTKSGLRLKDPFKGWTKTTRTDQYRDHGGKR